jgi:hypothetical protein
MAFGFWLLAFSFWLLAFGFWLLAALSLWLKPFTAYLGNSDARICLEGRGP